MASKTNIDTQILLRERSELKDRFEVIRALGEGTATTVYLVKDRQRDNQLRALKILVDKSAYDALTQRRFMDELKICQTLDHPHLVKAYDLIDLGYTVAFTMEYVEGEDLAHFLGKGKPSYDEVEKIFLQVLDGLADLHRRGICHRDLKLENVLRRNDGVVKVSDLGLMKREGLKDMTQTGMLLGTANYMPPEYIKNYTFDPRGDVWAVGLMIYELATGKRRLSNKQGIDAIKHLVATSFQLPSMSLAGLPKKLFYVITRALELKPENRFQSATEMRQALLMSDEQVQALFAPTVEIPMQSSLDISAMGPQRTKTVFGKQPHNGKTGMRSGRPTHPNFLWAGGTAALVLLMGIPAFVLSMRPSPALPDTIPYGEYQGEMSSDKELLSKSALLVAGEKGNFLDLGLKGCPSVNLSVHGGVIACLDREYSIRLKFEDETTLAGTVENANTQETFSVILKKKPADQAKLKTGPRKTP